MSQTYTTHKQAQGSYEVLHGDPRDVPQLCFTCDDCEMVYPPTWNGAFGWPNRCKTCNIRKCKWMRSKVWREALIRTYVASKKRILFLTFTEQDDEESIEYWYDNYHKEPVFNAEVKTRSMIKRWQKFKRTRYFKNTFPLGGLWVAECTTRMENVPDQTSLDGEVIPRMVWKVHPHIHCVVIADKIQIPMLLSAAAEFGFGTQIDVQEIKPRHSDYYGRDETKIEAIKRAVNYVTVYMNKEQPVTRSRDTWGKVRLECAIVREEQAIARDLKLKQ